jgi:pimeloyl-ACP methyl ester carboxylesterase
VVSRLVLLAPLLGGCVSLFLGSSETPLRTVEFPVQPKSRTLLVLIHGSGDTPEMFETHHFVSELRQRGADVEVVAVQSKLIYFLDNQIDDRIHEDVVLPAKENGIDRVILLGISSGGLAAIAYAHRHPVDGLILFAPFLGPAIFTREIEAQGGLLSWWPNAPFEEIEFHLLWLADYGRGREDPPIDLMYGASDRFAKSLEMVAGVLPKDAVHVMDGRHNWKSWLRLWQDHLERDPFDLVPDNITSECRARRGASRHELPPHASEACRPREDRGSSSPS